MRHPFAFFFLLFILSLSLVVFSGCTSDSYDKGEGPYSLMRADLCELTVNGDKQAVSFVTDDGDNLLLTTPVSSSWMTTPDTLYRALVYYNKVSASSADPLSVGRVVTLRPVAHWRIDSVPPTDPVGVESTWVSRGGKYINLGLLIRTGQQDGQSFTHHVGLVQDTVMDNADRTQTAYYHFSHNSHGAPEYYTNRTYVSLFMPTDDRPDTVCLSVNTYDGIRQLRYALTRR